MKRFWFAYYEHLCNLSLKLIICVSMCTCEVIVCLLLVLRFYLGEG